MKAKARITNVTINGAEYTATYESGTVRKGTVNKMPATVKACLKERETVEAVEIVLEELPQQGAIHTPAPTERSLTDEELDAFATAFAADMEAEQEIKPVVASTETEQDIKPVSVVVSAVSALAAGLPIVAVEMVAGLSIISLQAVAMVARWLSKLLTSIADHADDAQAHIPDIKKAVHKATARIIDTVLDIAAWTVYKATEYGTEIAWYIAGAICTVRLTDIVPFKKNHLKAACMQKMPDYESYAWILDDLKIIRPIPLKGKLGLWTYDGEVEYLQEPETDEEDERMYHEIWEPLFIE